MAQYHINPANGEAGACRAQKGNCPFSAGSEHYDSLADARRGYEAIMSGQTPTPLSWLLSARGERLSGPENSAALARELHEEYEQLKTKITEEQASQLHNYSMFGFERVNPLLRGMPLQITAFDSEEEALERTREQVKAIDAVFSSATEKQRTVYRYVKAPEGLTVKEAVEQLREKGSYTELAYMSTSASVDYPLYEVLENPKDRLFLLELATDRGVAIQPKARHQPGHIQSMENEILLPRGMTFEVAGVELRKHIGFGGMKSALLEHANIWTRRDRWQMEQKPHHTLPLVKLTQK